MQQIEVGNIISVMFQNGTNVSQKPSKVLAKKTSGSMGSILVRTEDGSMLAGVNEVKKSGTIAYMAEGICRLGPSGYEPKKAASILGFKNVKSF